MLETLIVLLVLCWLLGIGTAHIVAADRSDPGRGPAEQEYVTE